MDEARMKIHQGRGWSDGVRGGAIFTMCPFPYPFLPPGAVGAWPRQSGQRRADRPVFRIPQEVSGDPGPHLWRTPHMLVQNEETREWLPKWHPKKATLFTKLVMVDAYGSEQAATLSPGLAFAAVTPPSSSRSELVPDACWTRPRPRGEEPAPA